MSVANNVSCQFFKGRDLRCEHQSCVNIDRRKEEMRGHDRRRESVGGKESVDTL